MNLTARDDEGLVLIVETAPSAQGIARPEHAMTNPDENTIVIDLEEYERFFHQSTIPRYAAIALYRVPEGVSNTEHFAVHALDAKGLDPAEFDALIAYRRPGDDAARWNSALEDAIEQVRSRAHTVYARDRS